MWFMSNWLWQSIASSRLWEQFWIVDWQELRAKVLHGKYRVPYQMSTDCENLIGKLLVLNPEHRACLEVRTSIFCTLLCILVTVYVLIQHIVLFVSKVVFSLFDHDVFSGLFMRFNGSTVSYVCFMLATSFLCTLRLLSRHVFILMNKLTLKNSKYLVVVVVAAAAADCSESPVWIIHDVCPKVAPILQKILALYLTLKLGSYTDFIDFLDVFRICCVLD